MNNVHKNFGFFYPLPPCLHLELIYTIKFRQHVRFSMTPLRPLMRTSYLEAP